MCGNKREREKLNNLMAKVKCFMEVSEFGRNLSNYGYVVKLRHGQARIDYIDGNRNVCWFRYYLLIDYDVKNWDY